MIDALPTLDGEVLRVAASWDRWRHGADAYWREAGTVYTRRGLFRNDEGQVYRLAYLDTDSPPEWVRVPARRVVA